ncbi:DUF3108 domain-containing protein [Paragemmobacter ruber]|uniref:DUF3108 domain-containing protein n=1 Tax=Paragemmobacter ruber TaxID=1985673 RepID=A0ABW9Y603_9RHOB|nr:DUF3108 domain-containing protein [Rhodobacter ruber]NBE07971.1 DUF3108 domain-containing protein [Rhodobacter ruber]
MLTTARRFAPTPLRPAPLRAILPLAILLLAATAPAPASAQDTKPQVEGAEYDLVTTGITAAQLGYSARQEGDRYVVTARFASTGLLALLRRVQFEATSEGLLTDTTPRPDRYAAQAEVGRRTGQTVVDYTDGTPRLTVDEPPRAPADWQIDPATQGGTVDPISALFVILRDAVPGTECNRAFRLFDGRRATELTVGPARPGTDGTLTCDGEYRRIAGYPPEDMAERTRFPFTLTLMPTADGRLRVTEVTMDSLIGKARLIRR